jgi:poly-gamma-glutamate capsule biosynthesis protein CapA/YwtB (metallophosphatase superfamily)
MSKVLMGFVGDVLVNRDEPRAVFSEVREVLDVPGVVFANLECAYTDFPRPVPSALAVLSAPANNLDVYAEVGFDVMSLANNHILDAGYAAMLETRSRLRAQGVMTCGVGDTLADAREPAIFNVDGLRVAFLAYASIFPIGYEARSNSPGLAPMRAYSFWREPFSNLHAPGLRPLITTVPDQTDLENLTEDIRRARGRADLVVTSFHWGDYSRRFHLTDHETRTARHCIDQGAHMVVGHHHHALRGMEWYRGRPIMYGLGHFVFDYRWEWSEEEYRKFLSDFGLDRLDQHEQSDYYTAPREGWPLLPMHEDTRLTVMAWATAGRDGVSDIGFLPCRLTQDGLVHPLSVSSPESNEVVSYLEKCNATQGLKSRIVLEGAQRIQRFRTLRVVPG